MKKSFVLLFWLMLNQNFAQNLLHTGALIQGGVEDGSKLVEAYVTPLNKAIIFGLSDVTYSKIKKNQKHRLLLSAKLAYVSIPKEDWTYDITKLNLQHFEPKDANKIMAQTVFGDSLKSITLVSKEKDLLGRPLIEFNSPAGGQKSGMFLPNLGATFRLRYTNLSVNVIPYITIPDSNFKVGMLGVGVQQDLAMFINSLQDKSFGISLQASGAYLYGHSDLEIQPGGIYTPVTITGSISGPYDNQEINIHYLSVNVAAYFDYDLSEHISFFAGAGINTGSSNIKVTGTYPVYVPDPIGLGSVVADDVYDPLDISSTFSREKFDLGVRGDWNKFYLQLNYNMATYGGLGLNVGYKML